MKTVTINITHGDTAVCLLEAIENEINQLLDMPGDPDDNDPWAKRILANLWPMRATLRDGLGITDEETP